MNKRSIVVDDETASLAGRVLAAGNPLGNTQVLLALMDQLAVANSVEELHTALKTLFGPYIENGLSLAGKVLSDEAKEHREAETEADIEDAPETIPETLATLHGFRTASLGLLKGMHPQTTTFAHLAIALDARPSEYHGVASEIVSSDLVIFKDGRVSASPRTMSNPDIPALPWPGRGQLP